MKSILFFDDFLVHRESTIKRKFHAPKWRDEHSFRDPESPYGMGYASVVAKPGRGYYLYYVCTTNRRDIAGELSTIVCMAESDDGLRWTPFETGRAPKNFPNYTLLGGVPAPAGWWVHRDADREGIAPRYLATNSPIARANVGLETIPSMVLTSHDGLDWTRVPGGEFLPHHSDTCNAILYNAIKERYQITLRRRWGERRVFQVESPDLTGWTEPHPVLHPSPIDPESTHFYGMPAFYYQPAGLFVGFLWNQRMPYNDIMGGPVTTEYAYSYDGALWNRTHTDSMPLREPGAYGGGSIYGSAMIEGDEEILVYAIARIEEHHAVRRTIDAGISSAVLLPGTLRKNGFVGLVSTRGRGEITTECLRLAIPEIRINIDAPLGGVSAQICDPEYRPVEGCTFDDCDEIHGNFLDARLRWRDETKFQDLVRGNRWLRLQLRLEHAEIFSIDTEFDFTINPLAPVYHGL